MGYTFFAKPIFGAKGSCTTRYQTFRESGEEVSSFGGRIKEGDVRGYCALTAIFLMTKEIDLG